MSIVFERHLYVYVDLYCFFFFWFSLLTPSLFPYYSNGICDVVIERHSDYETVDCLSIDLWFDQFRSKGVNRANMSMSYAAFD